MSPQPADSTTTVGPPTALASDSVLSIARQARIAHRRVFDGAVDDVVRLPDAAAAELIDGLSRTVRCSVRQIVPFSSYRDEDDFSHRVWRGVAAARDRQVALQRLYVIPPGGDPRGLVGRQIEADRRAGAECRRLNLGTGRHINRWSFATAVPLSELWLIDGCVVVRRELSDHAAPVWVVSARESDVRRAELLWRLWDAPDDPEAAADDGPDLTEPLLESAPMMHAMATMSCTRDHVDRTSCAWYHGAWQFLRLFDMVSSPTWHSAFYQKRLAAGLGGEGPQRVLITGAADYSLLAYVIAAARVTNKLQPNHLTVHVMDLCPTPLNACRWYAERVGLTVRLHEADILAETPTLARRFDVGSRAERGFDVIATDAFLTRFSRDEVGRVLDNWKALLRPGGQVITTVRLHPREPRPTGGVPSGLPQELVRYALRLRERALGWGGTITIDTDSLVRAARVYALKITSHDVGDLDDLVELARRHGFEALPGETGQPETAAVDGEIVKSTYARLVLTST